MDTAAADARLDELALPLFGLAGGDHRTAAGRARRRARQRAGLRRRPHERRRAVAGPRARDALRPPADPGRAGGRGRAPRRASTVHVLSAPTGWYAGLADGERLWLVDATMDGRRADPWSLRPHCAHELAFAALMGLSDRFERAGDTPPAPAAPRCCAAGCRCVVSSPRRSSAESRAGTGPTPSSSSTCSNPASRSIRTTSPVVCTWCAPRPCSTVPSAPSNTYSLSNRLSLAR